MATSSIAEQVAAIKELIAAQYIYDRAASRWYKLLEAVKTAPRLEEVGITWFPQWNVFQGAISGRAIEAFSPGLITDLELAEGDFIEAYCGAKGRTYIERPKMKGPVSRTFWYIGYMFIYGRDAMISTREGFNPYPAFPLDPLVHMVHRDRWGLIQDGMYVNEFLQGGGFLWELENWMKRNTVWVEGKSVDLIECDHDRYMELKRRWKL